MSNTLNMRYQRKQFQYLSSIKNWKRSRHGCRNECFKPTKGASKADLIEWHKEDLKLRRRRQLARQP